jgi:hypothetical protein
MRGYDVLCKARGIEMEADSIVVSVSATSKRNTTTPLTCGPGMAVTRRKGEGHGGLRLRLGRPVTWLARKRNAAGLMMPSGPVAWGAWPKTQRAQQQAFGPKSEKRENFYFLFLFLF